MTKNKSVRIEDDLWSRLVEESAGRIGVKPITLLHIAVDSYLNGELPKTTDKKNKERYIKEKEEKKKSIDWKYIKQNENESYFYNLRFFYGGEWLDDNHADFRKICRTVLATAHNGDRDGVIRAYLEAGCVIGPDEEEIPGTPDMESISGQLSDLPKFIQLSQKPAAPRVRDDTAAVVEATRLKRQAELDFLSKGDEDESDS